MISNFLSAYIIEILVLFLIIYISMYIKYLRDGKIWILRTSSSKISLHKYLTLLHETDCIVSREVLLDYIEHRFSSPFRDRYGIFGLNWGSYSIARKLNRFIPENQIKCLFYTNSIILNESDNTFVFADNKTFFSRIFYAFLYQAIIAIVAFSVIIIFLYIMSSYSDEFAETLTYNVTLTVFIITLIIFFYEALLRLYYTRNVIDDVIKNLPEDFQYTYVDYKDMLIRGKTDSYKEMFNEKYLFIRK